MPREKDSDACLLEKLHKLEQWVRSNLQMLRAREGVGIDGKLRSNWYFEDDAKEERKHFVFLKYQRKRLAAGCFPAVLQKINELLTWRSSTILIYRDRISVFVFLAEKAKDKPVITKFAKLGGSRRL